MKSKVLGLLAVGLLLSSNNASANIVTFSGSNVGGPLFASLYPSYLYDFSVSADGNYRFDTTTATIDTYIYVYPLGFSMTSPPVPIALNDDNADFSLSCGEPGRCSTAFAYLLAGNSYTFLIRGYGSATGTFSARIEGPSIDAVPEPGALALFGLGLAGLGLRRRKAA